jgi:hypothetical protein
VETAARPARATIGAEEATMESPQPQAGSLVTGATSRVKRLHVAGLDLALVKERLTRATEPDGA